MDTLAIGHAGPNTLPPPKKRPPRPPRGHARPRPFSPADPLGRLLLALEVDPCECRHEHAQGATAWHVDDDCLFWHVRPAGHRLHPDDWLRLLVAWSEKDYGERPLAPPATFRIAAAGLTEHAADEACRQARLEVYEQRARLRQPLFCAGDEQEATLADIEALGLLRLGGAA